MAKALNVSLGHHHRAVDDAACTADIFLRFIRMLEAGTYRKHRTVAYYAEALCVTPKHLHKISTQVSGRTPSYWIGQFTMMEIKHLMMHGKLTAKEVAAKLNFDNPSHFSRYLKKRCPHRYPGR